MNTYEKPIFRDPPPMDLYATPEETRPAAVSEKLSYLTTKLLIAASITNFVLVILTIVILSFFLTRTATKSEVRAAESLGSPGPSGLIGSPGPPGLMGSPGLPCKCPRSCRLSRPPRSCRFSRPLRSCWFSWPLKLSRRTRTAWDPWTARKSWISWTTRTTR